MRETVYWLVGPGAKVRHAVEFAPGAFPGGQLLPTVCNRWIKVPFAGRDAAVDAITARCPDCTDTVRPHQPCEVTWNA
ncbi:MULTISPECIES: hypothetical protein [Saccharopolyspora]|uniref:Uncharacterized protein n=1 Tax=Saccharopolyspora gregorii TaxID=33914 RepID=A0ABP6RZU5_9PSEU|nr:MULTISPECIES: hypothetical protein [Saccharopolyspora]MCA1186645.1 hypothetical protein [Saccharopolyspora sp. 6T]MCA1191790.1 hypothetical protein [Saccharopolyspora sp. 6V]MCA1227339.1 hypothetical protein [Saccharopolyspora sp. 6M]MCA1281177.1 hypothetical protein [Saccharopolyspora sp. 7B]